MIQAKSDLAWMLLARLHSVGVGVAVLPIHHPVVLKSDCNVIFGLLLKCLYGAECGQNRHADLAGDQILTVLLTPPRGKLMKQTHKI